MFYGANVRWSDGPGSPPDSHGEFGFAKDWSRYQKAVDAWITSNTGEIEKIIHSLAKNEKEYLDWLQNDMLKMVEDAVNNQEIIAEGLAERLAEAGLLPMYGMPSRTRVLYHTFRKKGTTYVLDTISRDLEVAISDFAPGAQKTKDKAIHTSIGFTPQLDVRGNALMVLGNDALVGKRRMTRCKNCGYNDVESTEVLEACPYCGYPEDEDLGIRQFKIATPQAFRTDLTPGEDGKESFDMAPGMPSAFVDFKVKSGKQDISGTNCTTKFSDYGRTWLINDNGGKLFKGTVTTTPPPPKDARSFRIPRLQRQWISNDNGNEELALAAGKNTEILFVSPTLVPLGLTLDPKHSKSGVRSAIVSAAFLLQRAIADKLDIDPEEIEIASYFTRSVPSSNGNETDIADIILMDSLPNGSGFVREAHKNFKEILNQTCNPKDTVSYTAILQSKDHSTKCAAACPDCLKVYGNMTYHGLLDWRLAISYLKVLLDPAYKVGLDGNFTSPELDGWLKTSQLLRDDFCKSFGFKTQNFGQLPGFVDGASRKYLIVHPLWNTRNSSGILADARAESGDSITGYIDTFNLLRRPGKCKSWLQQQVIENGL